MIKKDRRHGTKGRIIGAAVRQNALKAGAHASDLYSARSYAWRLMACLDSLGLLTGEQPSQPGADQSAPAAAAATATAAATAAAAPAQVPTTAAAAAAATATATATATAPADDSSTV